jgi:hypothetical protein
MSASGATIPPCLIFKGQNLNSGWIPNETPAGWKFITLKKDWTSDLIGFEWLKSHFQPFVSQTSNPRHLLIIDGHSSRVTARFIAYCITSKIDLFLLPPHLLHKTQPLDLSIFGIFKGQNLNSGWIPDETPAGWRFVTSKKGWTSDLIGFEWLKTHF